MTARPQIKISTTTCDVWLTVCRYLLGAVLLCDGLLKASRPFDLLASIYDYRTVSAQTGIVVAVAMPWIECLVGMCLVGNVLVGGALLAAIGVCAGSLYFGVRTIGGSTGIAAGACGLAHEFGLSGLARLILDVVLLLAAVTGKAVLLFRPS